MAERFVVQGLAGQRLLRGSIAVAGAKNAIVASLPASLLFEDVLTLTNVPTIEDVATESEILTELGARVIATMPGTISIDTTAVHKSDLPDAIARKIRASIVFAGPLLARFGHVSFPHPGGDIIGPRPINLFLEGFQKMGATVTLEGETYIVKVDKLVGADIAFEPITVTGTETLMMAAALAHGTTTLSNAAREPEIVALAEFLNSCGANISGAGTATITIVGSDGKLLRSNGKSLATVPDRIETGTFVLLAALAGEKVTITNCNPTYVQTLIEMLQKSGVPIVTGADYIEVQGCASPQPIDVVTTEYPGFATDLQPPMMVYLTQAHGNSTLAETIWKGRLAYTADLVEMGAKIILTDSQHAQVSGPTSLHARELKSPDIRAGLAFLMAAAIASGTSIIDNVYHIDRGYGAIEERLQKLGLDIKRETV